MRTFRGKSGALVGHDDIHFMFNRSIEKSSLHLEGRTGQICYLQVRWEEGESSRYQSICGLGQTHLNKVS